MLSEDKTNADIARGNRAKLLLEDDLLIEAFEAVKAQYMDLWQATSLNDTATREKLFLAVQNVGFVRQHLVKVMDNGKIAKSDLEQRERGKFLGLVRA